MEIIFSAGIVKVQAKEITAILIKELIRCIIDELNSGILFLVGMGIFNHNKRFPHKSVLSLVEEFDSNNRSD